MYWALWVGTLLTGLEAITLLTQSKEKRDKLSTGVGLVAAIVAVCGFFELFSL